MKTIADIKEKLKKLIAKEESARKLGNQAEAEAFAAKIQELLMQYELDINELKAHTAETTTVNQEWFDVSGLTGRNESDWVRHLYGACKRANFCEVIFDANSQYHIYIVGTAMNRELLHFMCAQLVVKLRTLARDSFKKYEGPDKRNTYIRSFLKGACNGIRTKLNLDRYAQQQAHENIAALVIQKDRAVNNFVEQNFGRLGTHKPRVPGSAGGYAEGFERGKNVDIHKGVNRGAGGTLLLGK